MTTATMRPGKTEARRGGVVDALWDAHREGPTDATRNRLVEWYYPLVRHHAARVGKNLWGLVEADDLITPGAVGLMQSIQAFDPARGVRFETFAVPRIVGEMREELRRADWLSQHVRVRVKMVESAREGLTASLGHEPTDEETVDGLGLDAGECRRAIADAEFRISSLDRKVGHATNGERHVMLCHVLADGRAAPPDAGLERGDVWDLASRCLSARQREVIRGCYFEDLTLAQIGLRIGVSEQRVCQIRAASIRLIRERFSNRLAAYIA